MSLDRKELDREEAKDDCIKHGAPTLGVDHNNHYRPIEELMAIEEDKEKE